VFAVKWRRAVLVAGVDTYSFCNYITTAISQTFSVNKNMTLAATILFEERYTHDKIDQALDKIRRNGRSIIKRLIRILICFYLIFFFHFCSYL